ncbi:MAG TPA: hypothetical protein VMV92_17370 [Streptosporangiaceae bacterium]|nr:hypothetical protein [Streptosporangiaceae bacterium]
MRTAPGELDIPLPDGTLRVLRWGSGRRNAVALHGITASAAGWQPVAEALPGDWTLFALDLRGAYRRHPRLPAARRRAVPDHP